MSLIHHVPVDRTDRMRGHGLVLGGVDLTNRVTKDGLVRIEVDKANDLVDKPAFTFDFKSGDSSMSTLRPVPRPQRRSWLSIRGGTTPRPKGRAVRMPKAMQTAMRALRKAIDDTGTLPPASNNIPAGAKVVSFEQWRQYAYASGISTSAEARAQQQAFKRASEWLIGDGGHVGAWHEQVWLVL